MKQMNQIIKRLVDIFATCVGLVVLSPVFVITATIIYLRMGSPVYFQQRRPGLKGKPFKMFKFRTMTNETDTNNNLLPDVDRVTGLGQLLRRTSIDELPELFNVLRGDMSLVGPRPLLVEYLEYYDAEQMRRHDVRPGITGWAQINGRNALTWEEKFELDIWYVDNHSLWLDLKIICITIWKVLKRESIGSDISCTVPFRGSPPIES